MKTTLALLVLSFAIAAFAASAISIGQVQGAWWSDQRNPTADFAIHGDRVWLDADAQYHPCRIEGDILVFDLGAGQGEVRHRIVSLKGDEMVLEHMPSRQTVTLKREGP